MIREENLIPLSGDFLPGQRLTLIDGVFVPVGFGADKVPGTTVIKDIGKGLYYKCTAVSNTTWSGNKAFQNEDGTWSFEDAVTTGLTFAEITPEKGKVYSFDALVEVKLWTGAIDYKYLRFQIDANRGGYDTQLSEFVLIGVNGNEMSWSSLNIESVTTNTSPHGSEVVANLVDNSASNKWNAPIIHPHYADIVFRVPIQNFFEKYIGYSWYTANDAPERDPISWSVYVSEDGTEWEQISKVENASITDSRSTIAGTWYFKLVIVCADIIEKGIALNKTFSYNLNIKDTEGNSASYELISGELPEGVTFDASTGTFSGTPITEGSYAVVIRCYTSNAEKEVTFTLNIKDAMEIPENATVSSIEYSSYSCPINPTGYTQGNYTISASSELSFDVRKSYNAFYDHGNLDEEQSGWHSYGSAPQWLQWQNTSNKVLITGYSMSFVYRYNNHPYEWKLEGSDDGNTWNELDYVPEFYGYWNPETGEAGNMTLHRVITNTTPYYYHRINVLNAEGEYVTIGLIRVGEVIEYAT